MFSAALFAILKTCSHTKCPQMAERIKKNLVYNTMERYSAFKNQGNPTTYAMTRMNPEDVMLSEISQSQKEKYRMMPLSYLSPTHGLGGQNSGCQGAGLGRERLEIANIHFKI